MRRIRNLAMLIFVGVVCAAVLVGCSSKPVILLKASIIDLYVGETHQIDAEVQNYADAPEIVYSSSNEKVAQVTSGGMILALSSGEVQITVSCGEYSRYIKVTVKDVPTLSVSGADKVSVGGKITLTAKLQHAEGELVWSSSNPAVATVENGVVTGVSEGNVTITVTVGDLVASHEVQVVALPTLTLEGPNEVYVGSTIELNAVLANAEGELTWSSSDEAVATVENGVVTGVAIGNAQIKVAFGELEATLEVEVKGVPVLKLEGDQVVSIGSSITLSVVKEYLEGEVEWSSSNNEVATVENGVVTGVSEGTVTIRVVCGELEATLEVEVKSLPSLSLSGEHSVYVGSTITLVAELKNAEGELVWSSSDEEIATVENGVVTGVSVGKAIITVAYGTIEATLEVEVKGVPNLKLEGEQEVFVASSITLTAVKEYLEGEVEWYTSDENIAVVLDGVVVGIAKGTVVITVKCGELEATLEVTVKETAPVDEPDIVIGAGQTYTTIAAGLEAAKPFDVVLILAGTYNEDVTISTSNLTIIGPNAGVNPNTGTRKAEAIITGKVTIAQGVNGLIIDGLAFTGAGSVYTTQVLNFTFQNNNVYNTSDAPKAWQEGTGYVTGFVAIGEAGTSKNLEFFNNRFEGVKDVNVNISKVCNVSFDGNVFKNFGYDAIRFDDSTYEYGMLSFTNNEFVQDTLGGYNGIYFRSYGGASANDTTIVIKGNKFIKIGNNSNIFSGAITARNYQEKGSVWTITDNYFEACYNYMRIRNNGTVANHAAYPWVCTVENNQFIGLPTTHYFSARNATDSDASQNPEITVFGANYYEDNNGKVITDLSQYAQYFLQVKTSGTALSAKPAEKTIEPFEFHTIHYELNGGTVSDTLVTEFDSTNTKDILLPNISKQYYAFIGWKLNGEYVTVIPAGTKGNLYVEAEFKELDGEFYDITFVDKDGLGTYPTRDAENKAEILKLLYADIYEWAVDNGETKGYDEWYAGFTSTMQGGASTNLRSPSLGAYPTEDGSTEYFLNIPKYYEKWIEFFKLFDKAMQAVNSSQIFFSSNDYASYIRFYEFTVSSRAKLDDFLSDMLKVVRVEKEVVSKYQQGETVILPVLTNKLGLKFYGWYDNPEFTGEPITSITAADSGDKTFYAKWEGETVATQIVINSIETIKRYETHQFVWSFLPANTTNQSVEFFSSDESIASVSGLTGLLTAHKNGEVTITMVVYGNRALDVTMHITVYSPDHLVGEYETESLVAVNEEITLKATNAYNPTATVTWSSKNEDIAYVDATSGVVTGVSAGVATIVATSKDSKGNDITLEFLVTVVTEALTGVSEFVASSNNANIFTSYELFINGNLPFYEDILGSVNKVLMNEKLNINTDYLNAGDAKRVGYAVGTDEFKANRGKYEMASIEFITVHYTANNSSTAGAKTHASYFTGTGTTSSIHYTTGNDGVYQAQSDDLRAGHAGDGTSYTFSWQPTGVMYDDCDLLNVQFSASNDFYFEINGKKTSIKLPSTWNYNSRNTDHIYNSDGTITSQSDYTGVQFANRPVEEFFNDQGLSVTVIDGQYYMGQTWWCFDQVHEGRICSYGGNLNSIGIESAVNTGSDLWLTWQKTAQLVAKLMVEYNLDISRVKGHHFYSGKDCPQPMLENDMEIWWEFIDLVKAEYDLLTNYSSYTIEMKSNNPDLVDNKGRVIKQPEYATSVSYTVTIKDASGNVVNTLTLASMIPGVYER